MINDEKKLTILVVDDSDLIRTSLKTFFGDYNIKVITSNDGLDGIQKAVKYKPSLIFLDLLMPNFDGIKMLQVIKVLDHIKVIPVIVISGNTNRTNVIASLEAGAERVISKPLKKEILLKNINEILGSNFLKNAKLSSKESNVNNDELKQKLTESFLNTFSDRKNIIERSLFNHNVAEIQKIAHELKGEGGMIGLNKLSLLGGKIEDHLSKKDIDWNNIKKMYNQVFAIVSNLEELNFKNME